MLFPSFDPNSVDARKHPCETAPDFWVATCQDIPEACFGAACGGFCLDLVVESGDELLPLFLKPGTFKYHVFFGILHFHRGVEEGAMQTISFLRGLKGAAAKPIRIDARQWELAA